MTSFIKLLENRMEQVQSLLCVGLDPHIEDLPAGSSRDYQLMAEQARDFCLRIIGATSDLAAAYKPNAAFFEQLGASGWKALKEVVNAVPNEIPVLVDAKRGDIASTARAYAKSIFQYLDADAVTLSPYLGYDSIEPFLEKESKGVFLLCKTSNPGASDLQDLICTSEGQSHPLFIKVAQKAQQWNKNGNIGLVVGATQLDALRKVRAAAPDIVLLTPGVGAQGADIQAALKAGLRKDGSGMLIPVSRGISRAENPREAALELVEKIRKIQKTIKTTSTVQLQRFNSDKAELADALLESECVRFGSFTLKSGIESPFYIDLRRLVSRPDVLRLAANAYSSLLETLQYDRIAALPYAALPIGTAVSLITNTPLIYPRKEVKSYGTKSPIEGLHQEGETTVVLDDLATTGGSKFEAIEKLEAAGLKVNDIVVLIDRQSGANQILAEAGYKMHAVFKIRELFQYWLDHEKIEEHKIQAAFRFLESQ